MQPKPMTRTDAIQHIENLYGFDHESVADAIASLGQSAFSDEAIARIAEAQLQVEHKLGQELDAVERYQGRHPGTSWNEAKRLVQQGRV